VSERSHRLTARLHPKAGCDILDPHAPALTHEAKEPSHGGRCDRVQLREDSRNLTETPAAGVRSLDQIQCLLALGGGGVQRPEEHLQFGDTGLVESALPVSDSASGEARCLGERS